MIMRIPAFAAVAVIASLVAGDAAAQQIFVFPAQGQTPAQQAADESACNSWAVTQSGFNPQTAPTSPPSSRQANQGGVLRGGARGAATGAAVGAIMGDAGRGAAIGATSGAMFGGMRRTDQRRNQNAQDAAWWREQDAAYDAWRRAYTACLVGKGYTVS